MAKKHNQTGRSSRSLSPFIALERYIKASPAWQSLSLAARCAYLELLDLYTGSNNGKLAVSAKMLADRLPIGRATANRAIAELQVKGFIEPVRLGSFSVKYGDRRATEWRLTRYRCDATGAAPSKTFMRWQAGKIHFTVSPQSTNGLTTEHGNGVAQ
ncbi:MAG: hypothetical protein ACKVP5_07700 [Aestuariivirga sp.]